MHNYAVARVCQARPTRTAEIQADNPAAAAEAYSRSHFAQLVELEEDELWVKDMATGEITFWIVQAEYNPVAVVSPMPNDRMVEILSIPEGVRA